MTLTQRQYCLLIRVLESLPKALASIESDDTLAESVPSTPARSISNTTTPGDQTPMESSVSLEPELAVTKRANGDRLDVWTKLKVTFAVQAIALEVFSSQAHQEDDLHKHSIAQFALQQSDLALKQLSDGAMELEFTLGTLSFSNTTAGDCVHREIIPAADHDGHQL